MFRYKSVVGVFLYLPGNNCPDFTLAVNCCAWSMFIPKFSHELALNRLVCYLKQMKDHGLLLYPNSGVYKVDAYPCANFLGCVEIRSLLVLHVIRFVPALSLHLHIVLFCGFKSYRPRLLS